MAIPLVFVPDGNWYINRAFYTVRRVPGWTDKQYGQALAYRVLSMICGDAIIVNATHVIVPFDGPKGFRYKVWPAYKANRDPASKGKNTDKRAVSADTGMPQREVYNYLSYVLDMLTAAGITWVQLDEYEADDVMSAIARGASPKTYRLVMGTRDKDMFQTLKRGVGMFYTDPVTKKHMMINVDVAVAKCFGVRIDQMIELQIMLGDKTDNIPQMKVGLGIKTIAKILVKHGSIKEYYKQADKKTKAWLISKQAAMRRNRKLVTMVDTCYEFDLSKATVEYEAKRGKLVFPPNHSEFIQKLTGQRSRPSKLFKKNTVVADLDDLPDQAKPRTRLKRKGMIL